MTAIISADFFAAARLSNETGMTHAEAQAVIVAQLRETMLFTRNGRPCHEAVITVNGKPHFQSREKCNRCGGHGGWAGWPGFTCFKCGGECYLPVKAVRLYTADEIDRLDAIAAKKQATRDAKAAKAAEKKAAEKAARIDSLRQSEELFRNLEAMSNGDSFLSDILAKWSVSDITERQREAAEAAILRKKARKAEAANSAHVGTVGERRDFTLTVKVCMAREGQFGISYFHVMADDSGNTFIYSGSVCMGERGETVCLKATIKDHSERQGTPQTVIARPKMAA